MTKGIKRAILGITLSFLVLSCGLLYWQIFADENLLSKPGNLRLVYEEQKIWRGGIFDRNGEILAKSYPKEEAIKLGWQVVPLIKPPDGQYQAQIRLYPKGEDFAHIVGTHSIVYGKSGLEEALDKVLLGLGPDENIRSTTKQIFGNSRRGNDVVLTLDSNIQRAAVEALKEKSGAAIAIDPKSGKILAMVSSPYFDPNKLDQNYKQIEVVGNQVFVNKAVGAAFTPGSVMKLVTAGAILRSGLDVNEIYVDSGRDRIVAEGESREVVDSVREGLGPINFYQALAKSSNTYFATRTATAGKSAFLDAAGRFGFNQRIPLELTVANSTINHTGLPQTLTLGQLVDSSYGQGEVQVTPLHMAMITASVANGGKMMRPGLVDRVINPEQVVLYRFTPEIWNTPLTSAEADMIRKGMIEAVQYGTAKGMAISGTSVAAKTGTAELGEHGLLPHGWLVAFAPADNPIIAVAVIIEHGQSGAASAGPVAREIIQAALRERR